jgi:hypothetical protein
MNSIHSKLESESASVAGLSVQHGVLGQPGEEFLSRVRQATVNVLGDSSTGREVLELCDDHAQARRMILEDRSGGMNVVAVIGATGQGKSWLIRQLIRESSGASSAIRSGNHADEATGALVWVGPRPPADLDPQHERYIHCSASDMESIGTPYMLLDAPGATDDRRSFAAVAARSLSLASVLLLIVRRDQIRSEVLGMLAEASEGSLVIPIINVVRTRDEKLEADTDAFVARIRQSAPTSIVAAPVIIEDFELDGRTEQDVGEEAAKAVASRLQSELGNSWEGDRRRSTRLAALDGRFRSALHSVLGDQLPGLTAAVRRLNREATMLPVEVAETLVGRGGPLRAVIRSRLRMSLLTETAAIWFPYKSMLGMLNLTHGAWDRLLLTLSGSLPSLVTAVWTTSKNLSAERGAQQDFRDGLQRRSAAAVADRLGPLVMRFRSELMELRHQQPNEIASLRGSDSTSQVAYLSGIDALQESSQRIFDDEVERVCISRPLAALFGLVGTLIFWALMSGPIVALYRGYFTASYETLAELSGDLEHFPKPEFSMMVTSFLLSILPTSLFSMLVLSLAQGRRRVVGAETRIRQLHHETIERMQRDGILRLRWDEPILADAEFLLSAGAAEMDAP